MRGGGAGRGRVAGVWLGRQGARGARGSIGAFVAFVTTSQKEVVIRVAFVT